MSANSAVLAAEYAAGADYRDLIARYGVCAATVSAALREHGVTPRPRGGYRRQHAARNARIRAGLPVEGVRVWCDTEQRPCAIRDVAGSCAICEGVRLRTAYGISSHLDAQDVRLS